MILVTGASGFIGSHLVRALVDEGHAVRALVRSPAAAGKVRAATGDSGVELAEGDLADADSLKRAASDCELVYHLAGAYRGSPAELHTSHVAGTAKLLRSLDPATRLVHVSSTAVYGWNQQWPAGHDTPPRPESPYGKAKLAAEQLVRARAAGNTAVARPTITYGIGDAHGMLARMARLLFRGVRRLPGNGDNRIHLTHVDDLVSGLMALAEGGDGVFVFGGPEAAPVRRIAELLAAGAGVRPPEFGIPAGPLRLLSGGLESVWGVARLDGEPPVSVHSVDVATRDRAYSWERAAAELNWRPAVALEEGLPATGAWLAAEVSRRRPLPGFEPASDPGAPSALGFDWRGYFEDPDEGLGTVYERFALADVLEMAMEKTGSRSVLHAPLFGMMGIPGLDAVFLARRGVEVGLLDFDADRLQAVERQWQELGLKPTTHLVGSPDPSTWPDQLEAEYDLVFSFAALWWFEDPWGVLAAQARWARRGVLSCVPNKNVFMKMRARLWHKDLFDRLNEEALDAAAMTAAAEELGMVPVDTGLFDIPPFPDTSVPLAKVLRAMLGKKPVEVPVAGAGAESAAAPGAWRWSILPYLTGEQPDLRDRIDRLTHLERRIPGAVAPGLAHHRYVLYSSSPESTGTPPALNPSSVLMRRMSGRGT